MLLLFTYWCLMKYSWCFFSPQCSAPPSIDSNLYRQDDLGDTSTTELPPTSNEDMLWTVWLVYLWGFYTLVTVMVLWGRVPTHSWNDFTMLSHWETRSLAPRPDIPLSRIILILDKCYLSYAKHQARYINFLFSDLTRPGYEPATFHTGSQGAPTIVAIRSS